MKVLSAEEVREKLLKEDNREKTYSELATDEFETNQKAKQKAKLHKIICKSWIEANQDRRTRSEKVVAETLQAYINGENPFRSIEDGRGGSIDQTRAFAIWHALVETNNIEEVAGLFQSRPKEIKETIGRLGVRLDIAVISEEFKAYKGFTPMFKEMMHSATGNTTLVSIGSKCFFDTYEYYSDFSSSAEEWLLKNKKTKKKGGG